MDGHISLALMSGPFWAGAESPSDRKIAERPMAGPKSARKESLVCDPENEREKIWLEMAWKALNF